MKRNAVGSYFVARNQKENRKERTIATPGLSGKASKDPASDTLDDDQSGSFALTESMEGFSCISKI